MVRRLIAWAVSSRLVVILLTLVLVAVGAYSFTHVNVEAYPDPAPAIIEVVTQYPGASAKDVERQLTIPIEVAVAGIPGLQSTRSKSLSGLSYVSNQFAYGVDYYRARQEVILRLQQTDLPPNVTPQISPASPIAEIIEYTVVGPKDENGRDIYSLNDLKAIHDWTISREFRRVPRIADAVSFGGSVKRYEVQPDPDRLRQYGVTLQQLQDALANSNSNVGGDYVVQGHTVQVVRGIGLLGGGEDPLQYVLGFDSPIVARDYIRAEEKRRILQIRQIVISATNNVPVRVEQIVDGGPLKPGQAVGERGVLVGNRTRLGQVGISRLVLDEKGRETFDANGERRFDDQNDVVQANIYLRKGEESLPALRDCMAKIKEMNETPGRLPPGVKIDTYYDRTELINVTTETVRENLLVGMVLVTVVLLMFLSNIRCALIVAINVPLAVLFAFAVLFLRGRSANLLSIGAVDFGIIVDSTVILVENVYRHLSTGENAERPLKERIIRAAGEVERSLFFSTIIMVCAMLPLFTMKGPEGEIFGPMADTYAFALVGALILALTLSPVLCTIFLRKVKPTRDNMLVRGLKAGYVGQLKFFMNCRWLALLIVGVLVAITALVLPGLGREFMPELEEGNMYIRAIFPINISLEESTEKVKTIREIMRKYPEVQLVMSQSGRPDAGTDPGGFYYTEILVPLKPFDQWPAVKKQEGWQLLYRDKRPRTKQELIDELNAELSLNMVSVDWSFSQDIRDNVMEVLSGVKGENSVKIIGPDIDELERLAEHVKNILSTVPGIENAGVLRIKGQSNLEFPVDRDKCADWSVSVQDVQNVIQSAVGGGKPATQIIEGEKNFDLVVRWPADLRSDQSAILNIPVDVTNHKITSGSPPELSGTPLTGGSSGTATTGTSAKMPSPTGSSQTAPNALSGNPRRRLADLVTPLNDQGQPDPTGSFVRPGASTIARENGNRLIAVKFGIRGRDLASTVADAQEKIAPVLHPPYRTEWSGEFEEMEQAEKRLIRVLAIALVLILVLLYLAFRSLLDAALVMSSVVVISLGGIWALLATGANLNVSGAVGFVSILGVAVMNGLLMVSAFNSLRAQGVPLREAIVRGVERLIRPVTMTALAAIFGLLPAALSNKIGSETQKPLAIVVVGGMLATLLMMNLVPILYSFYGALQPRMDVTSLGH
jgi:cobalt-zinc-cadmium resistance protein CzcA